MGKYLSEEVIEEVRRAADIVSVISEYVSLKKTGSNFVALCPFHTEKTPSFSVSPQRQIFKCFGCGKAGNIFHFMMGISGLTFPEAVIQLAKKYGIAIQTTEATSPEEHQKRHELIALLKWSTHFFQKQLMSEEGKQARDYLQSRKIAPGIVEQFQLGFAPPSYYKFYRAARHEGFAIDLIEKSGLIVKSRIKTEEFYDLFRNRVIFPICNVEGEVIAFGGRVLSSEDKPKYLNSPETPIFSKKKVLYALNQARSHAKNDGYFIIMEGYTDVLMAHQYNFFQAVATLGTSLTEDHVKVMRRYVPSVMLIYDGDSAGQNAMLRVLNCFIKNGLALRIAVLPAEFDPCDLLVEKGRDDFQAVMDRSQDVFDFQIQKVSQHFDFKTTIGQREAIRELRQTLEQIPDRITQRLFTTKVGEFFKIPPDFLFLELMGKRRRQPLSNNQLDTYRQYLQQEDEEFLLWVTLHYPEKKMEIFQHYNPANFRSSNFAELAQVIAVHNESLDVASLAAKISPELGEKLVKIYYTDDESFCQDQLESRLHFIFKAVAYQRQRARLNKLREILSTTAPDDREFKLKILQDAHAICKDRMEN